MLRRVLWVVVLLEDEEGGADDVGVVVVVEGSMAFLRISTYWN
jgi:hypothetical protein